MGTVDHNNNLYGKVGDLVYYKLDKKNVVRKIGKVDKDRYKLDKSFEGMRNNMSEFGAASMIGKVLRDGFAPYSKEFGDPIISGRLNRVFRNIIGEGKGEPGKRSFSISQHGELLKGFKFNPEKSFGSIFYEKGSTITTQKDRTCVVWEIPTYNPKDYIRKPRSATHFRLLFNGVLLSDYDFDVKTKKYLPVEGIQNGDAVGVSSDLIALNTNTTAPMELMLELDATQLPDSTAVVVATGIVFYKHEQGTYYELANSKCMEVIEVF